MNQEWPYRPVVHPAVPATPGTARMVNLMIPVRFEGCEADIHMTLPEAQARQIANLDPQAAAALGAFFGPAAVVPAAAIGVIVLMFVY